MLKITITPILKNDTDAVRKKGKASGLLENKKSVKLLAPLYTSGNATPGSSGRSSESVSNRIPG
jgi:hypothetical protein